MYSPNREPLCQGPVPTCKQWALRSHMSCSLSSSCQQGHGAPLPAALWVSGTGSAHSPLVILRLTLSLSLPPTSSKCIMLCNYSGYSTLAQSNADNDKSVSKCLMMTLRQSCAIWGRMNLNLWSFYILSVEKNGCLPPCLFLCGKHFTNWATSSALPIQALDSASQRNPLFSLRREWCPVAHTGGWPRHCYSRPFKVAKGHGNVRKNK